MSIPGAANPLLLATAAAGGYQISRSLRFSSNDSAFLSRTPASAGNRKTWTWAGWAKRSKLTNALAKIFNAGSSVTAYTGFQFIAGEKLEIFHYTGSYIVQLVTAQVFRDTSAWCHILVSIDTTAASSSDRVRLYVNGSRVTAFETATYPALNAEYEINNSSFHALSKASITGESYHFDGYLADVHFIDGQALDPSSFVETSATTGQLIPKAYTGSFGTNGFWLKFSDNSAATATTLGKDYSGNSNNWSPTNLSVGNESTEQPRWYSSSTLYSTKAAVVANATPRGTGSFATTSGGEYVYLVLNGGGTPGTNNVFTSNFGSSFNMYGNVGGVYTRDGSYTSSEAPLIGWTNGSFTPANYQISNTQDFYAFAASNNGGQPGNTFSSITVTALTTASFKNTSAQIGAGNDSLVDTPSSAGTDTGLGGQVTGNYCTWNPLKLNTNGSLANGNLDWSSSTGGGLTVGTIGVSSGKWYWEVSVTSGSNCGIGVFDPSAALTTYSSDSAKGIGYYGSSGSIFYNGGSASYGSTFTTGDVIGVALDLDNGKIYFAKNGTWQNSGNPATQTNPARTGLSGTYAPEIDAGASSAHSASLNAGARPFAYTAPSGFKALCDTNLPAPVVAKPDQFFQTVLWTGDNSNSRTISGLNFSPDLVWKKRRTANGDSHYFVDSVRGDNSGVMRTLFSNQTVSEQTTSSDQELQYGYISALTSSGFTVSAGSNASIPRAAVNDSSYAYVAWAFDAGTTTTTNTAGSITSQVRANASAGFSIVTASVASSASGPTIGHGLGVTPGLIIAKNRTSAIPWYVWHSSFSANQKLLLNSTSAVATDTNTWGSITSSTLQMGATGTAVNVAWVSSGTENFVFYCFAPVAGYSSFGSYVGNGSASDGPFVYTGFRPRFLLIKGSSVANTDWAIIDTARDTYNIATDYLAANSSGAEQTLNLLDVVSNGFKIKAYTDSTNQNNQTYVWAAWAESPFQYARAR